jgi:hypothetical protein
MAKTKSAKLDPQKRTSMGKHGGNRAGGRTRAASRPTRSVQSAGKDPRRGKKER